MPKELRAGLSKTYLMEPVATLEDLANRSEGGTLSEPWNPDVVAHFGRKIYQNRRCIQAWKVIPIGTIVAAIDAIRTRVLSFVLDIEAEAPEAGEAPLNSNPLPQDLVQQIFTTNIYGNVQNLANASPGANLYATYIAQDPELSKDLVGAIKASGATAEVIASVTESVTEMGGAANTSSFRIAYLKFISAVSDHIQVLGAVAPFIPQLTALLG